MGEKLSVYSPVGHSVEKYWQQYLIHPLRAFWGDGSDKWAEYEPSFAFYKELFYLTEQIEKADACFLPMTLNYYIGQKRIDLVEETCKEAAFHGLKCYIWIDGDFDVDLTFENAIFLKNASYKSNHKNSEIIRNGDLKKDLLQEYCNGEIQLKTKTDRPTVGFDGLSAYPIGRLAGLIGKNLFAWVSYQIRWTKYQPPPIIPLLILRNRILETIERDTEINSNFNRRKAFAIGTKGNSGQARLQFINNILQSDYTLCIRGSANYSLRLYEVMCLGRIPLFINTDCVLPFADQISWKDLVLWIEEKDKRYIGKAILDFHATIKERDFLDRQYECRRIWKEYLSDAGFFRHFTEDIALKELTQTQEI